MVEFSAAGISIGRIRVCLRGAIWLVTLGLLVAAEPAQRPNDGGGMMPDAGQTVEKAKSLVDRLLADDYTGEAEKQRLRVVHGRWDELGQESELPPALRARLALLRFDLDAPILAEEAAPARLCARAALYRGEPGRVLKLLKAEDGPVARLLVARARQQTGEAGDAVAALKPLREELQAQAIEDAAKLTAAARGLALLARLEGRPAADYHLVMDLLARARQDLDPLYWPAHLAEAELLMRKDNRQEAGEALQRALELNPRASRAWHLVGRLAAERYDFDRAEEAVDRLAAIHEDHLLKHQLQSHIALMQRDAPGARRALEPALERYPSQRRLLALKAASAGLAYDQQTLQATLGRFDELAPGAPQAYATAGRFLSMVRQYEQAEALLEKAVSRSPNWAEPQVELGLLRMQMGELQAAREALQRGTALDPFNRQASNQLALVQDLLSYQTLETEHFVIRYRDGVDQVLARDMAKRLEGIYERVTEAFQHEPAKKTQVDLLANEQQFAVRITGMPDIWTIAASTGPVVALTPPKSGAHQGGAFDWVNVIRHEFVHTVNLSQTRARLPHWFAEGAAVLHERNVRDYEDCQLLAWAVHHDELFPLEQINWGFVRPESQRDRPLAYAQAAWTLQYLQQREGDEVILELLNRYSKGAENVEALEAVSGESAEAFFEGFKAWAKKQVRAWGLGQRETPPRVKALLTGEADPEGEAELQSLLSEHPEHPDLARYVAKRRMEALNLSGEDAQAGELEANGQGNTNGEGAGADNVAAAREAVRRYAELRPVDPWADRALARLALHTDRVDEAIERLHRVDDRAGQHGGWAHQLAQLHRRRGEFEAGFEAAGRALEREPYNATYRELAATLALQNGDREAALHHLQALPLLEPERAQHHVRLAALCWRMDRREEAARHAKAAKELDANAPVERYLSQ